MSERDGMISLPLDKFGMSPREAATIDLGYELSTRDCMARSGFQFQVVDARFDPVQPDRRYGVWVPEEAARYGYEPPPSSPAQKALEKLNAASYPAGWDQAHLSCGQAAAKTFVADPLPSDLQAVDGYSDFLSTSGAKTVINEWKSCLHAHNVTPPRDGWVPESATSQGKENEIRVALVDVQCKKDHNVIQRLADLEASSQAVQVEKDEARLVAQRRSVEASLAAANKLIAEKGF